MEAPSLKTGKIIGTLPSGPRLLHTPAAMGRNTPFDRAFKLQNEGIFRIIPWLLSSNQET
jgi:hypothetical protein